MNICSEFHQFSSDLRILRVRGLVNFLFMRTTNNDLCLYDSIAEV